MTAAEMLSRLGTRSNNRWDSSGVYTKRLQFLNSAQDLLIKKINSVYLSEITESDNQSIVSNVIALSGLSPDILDDEGVVALKNQSSGVFYTPTAISAIKDITENPLLAPTDENPRYYVFGGNIYTFEERTSGTATVYYLRTPLAIEAAVDCELDASLHEIIVTLAESIGWGMDKKPARAAIALQAAVREINTLNGRQL
jgi:hypothetical protein